MNKRYWRKPYLIFFFLVALLINTVQTAYATGQAEVKENENEEVVEAPVKSIEIGDHDETLNVGSTLTLTATILPVEAANTTVSYKSSDDNIATVNSSGEVKGIAPGKVTIHVTAGKVKKEVPITVKIATTAIVLNKDYLILKPGQTFQLSAGVQPNGADPFLTYRTLNGGVASVNETGVVSATGCGDTSIIVSNQDMQSLVTVIVNKGVGATSLNYEENRDVEGAYAVTECPLEINAADYPVVTSEMLRYLYQTKQLLHIYGEGYEIFLNGSDIVNCENPLNTVIRFQRTSDGQIFKISEGEKLCGKITICLSQGLSDGKFLYLYNKQKGQYQQIEASDIKSLQIDTEGTYLITKKALVAGKVPIVIIMAGAVVLLLCGIAYVVWKKRYWFW